MGKNKKQEELHNNNSLSSLYIHIPFCKQKCSYCDFASYAGKEDLMDQYISKLTEELHFLLSANRFPLSTIYFGGGTPTLLPISNFEFLISNIQKLIPKFPRLQDGQAMSNLEITIEANPGTIDKEYLKALRDFGINRISIGVQSFNNKHLKTLGRIHDIKKIYQAFDAARDAGFDNINLDLIFAIPEQTLKEWQNDLKNALNLKPEHLSTYNLQVEEGTPLYEKLTSKGNDLNRRLLNEDLDAQMYEFAIDFIKENGYHHYEISNFAKKGLECRHNITYWENRNYIGIGAGAHSHINGKRWGNPETIEEYLDSKPVVKIKHEEDITYAAKETIFMGLRLIEGIPKEKFNGFETEVEKLKREDFLEEKNKRIKLTKKGLFFGNLVFEEFI